MPPDRLAHWPQRRRANRSPRTHTRYSTEAAINQKGQETGVKTVPRRRQNRERARCEKRRQSRSACSQIARHRPTRTLRRKLALLAVDGMVLVAPPVLKDKQTRCL